MDIANLVYLDFIIRIFTSFTPHRFLMSPHGKEAVIHQQIYILKIPKGRKVDVCDSSLIGKSERLYFFIWPHVGYNDSNLCVLFDPEPHEKKKIHLKLNVGC